ncbi:MAG: ABC transporter permease, partial [Clostridia bacterium]|nr:ABC transporter permease [Clostridia bacterium]
MITTIFSFINAAIIQGIPLLFGSTGEIITEKSGNLNLGIPGIMYVGGVSGIIGGYLYEHGNESPSAALCILISLLSSLAGSALMSLVYAFLTTTLKANQNVTGLALTTFGVGVGNFFGGSLLKFFGESGSISLINTGLAYKASLPFASKLGIFGETFLSFGFLAYLAVIIAIITSYILNKTRTGLNLRAIGENPATADAAGINVTRYKYLSTLIG